MGFDNRIATHALEYLTWSVCDAPLGRLALHSLRSGHGLSIIRPLVVSLDHPSSFVWIRQWSNLVTDPLPHLSGLGAGDSLGSVR